ncbi:MAG: membrane protein insertase YidC [Marinilabiliales bacterium]|nr:MAG: membrane protein insertase YidC [Marinilabiliales bacterium]
MNKNSIVGFVLIAAIMIGYTIWMTPSAEELAQKQHIADSLQRVEEQRKIDLAKVQAENARKEVETTERLTNSDKTIESSPASEDYTAKVQKYDVFANSANGTDESIYIENDKIKVEVTKKGGHIINVELKDFKTYDSLALMLFNPNTSQFGFSFFSNNRIINTNDFYFQPSITDTKIISTGDNSVSLNMRLYTDLGDGQFNENQYIEYVYTLKVDEYMLDFDVNLVNMGNVINSNSVGLNWYADLRQQEINVDQFNGSTIYYRYLNDDVEYMSETDEDEENINTKLNWVSFKQRFFSSSLIAKQGFENGKLNVFEKENSEIDRYLKTMSVELGIPVNLAGTTNFPMQFYFGPNDFYLMKSYDLELERQIPIGWSFFILGWINQYIVIPVFNWLGGYGWNYGIVILVLTVMLKIVLFPIAYKTYMSSAKMRVLKPEVDELSKKFPKKEDAMKKQQAVMGLYRSAGANPASGCVPMLLQMPILIAMFRFFPASIELRQQSFLWATDLSSYDSIASLPFEIPFYGAHVSLFTLLMTVSTLMYTYLNNQMMGSQTQQMPGMKTMMYIMPLMFLGLFNNYASGLSYYYFLANIITFGQMFAFRYMINEDKLRAKIELNKKKPKKKKSGFQKRLEEAAKQRGYNAKK